MNILTRYASGRSKTAAEVDRNIRIWEHVRCIDPGADERGEPVSVYWEGMAQRAELLLADPQARCRTTEYPRLKRLATWWLAPIVLGLLMFAAVFLASADPIAAVPAAIAIGLLFGAPVGLLTAYVVNRRFFAEEAWWHFYRIPMEIHERFGIQPRDAKDSWVLMGIVPQPLMAKVEDDGVALATETQKMLWDNELLSLGEEGWATKNFLKALGAAKDREEILKGNQSRPSLDRPNPGDKGIPR